MSKSENRVEVLCDGDPLVRDMNPRVSVYLPPEYLTAVAVACDEAGIAQPALEDDERGIGCRLTLRRDEWGDVISCALEIDPRVADILYDATAPEGHELLDVRLSRDDWRQCVLAGLRPLAEWQADAPAHLGDEMPRAPYRGAMIVRTDTRGLDKIAEIVGPAKIDHRPPTSEGDGHERYR